MDTTVLKIKNIWNRRSKRTVQEHVIVRITLQSEKLLCFTYNFNFERGCRFSLAFPGRDAFSTFTLHRKLEERLDLDYAYLLHCSAIEKIFPSMISQSGKVVDLK